MSFLLAPFRAILTIPLLPLSIVAGVASWDASVTTDILGATSAFVMNGETMTYRRGHSPFTSTTQAPPAPIPRDMSRTRMIALAPKDFKDVFNHLPKINAESKDTIEKYLKALLVSGQGEHIEMRASLEVPGMTTAIRISGVKLSSGGSEDVESSEDGEMYQFNIKFAICSSPEAAMKHIGK